MSATQARLVDTRPRSERVDPDDVSRLMAHLDGRGLVTRRQLRQETGLSDDRLRAIARYSRGEVIGSSRGGYCLTRQAAVEDVGAIIGETLSRVRQLRARVVEVLQVLHGKPRTPAQGVTSYNVEQAALAPSVNPVNITSNKSGNDSLGGGA